MSTFQLNLPMAGSRECFNTFSSLIKRWDFPNLLNIYPSVSPARLCSVSELLVISVRQSALGSLGTNS
jgi:hypothetical protein